ncbi:Beta-lactamase-like protein [Rhypophila sp. PSN 637]
MSNSLNLPSPPDIHIPQSPHTVSVSIINTTSTIHGAKTSDFFGPPIKGHKWLAAPVFCFLIQHHEYEPSTGRPIPGRTRTLLFDLGIRKDWWNSAPSLVNTLRCIRDPPWTLETKASTERDSCAANIDIDTIEAIIWSHHHFDHTGDPSLFPLSTALIVGPGVADSLLPGYPDDPGSSLLKSDYEGRELIELDFAVVSGEKRFKTITIGQLPAIDYFGDGSLYLLDTPGHAVGHICALARVTSSTRMSAIVSQRPDMDTPDTFVLLAGDAFHHPGELRPSEWLRIPDKLAAADSHAEPEVLSCRKEQFTIPGAVFTALLPPQPDLKSKDPSSNAGPATGDEDGWHHDPVRAAQTLHKLQEFDAQKNILILAAHDESLLDLNLNLGISLDPEHMPTFFPKGTLDNWFEYGLKDKLTWVFLRDFIGAIPSESSGSGTGDGEQEEGRLRLPHEPSVETHLGKDGKSQGGAGFDSGYHDVLSEEDRDLLTMLNERWEKTKDYWAPVDGSSVSSDVTMRPE